jgi:hypothetical protein
MANQNKEKLLLDNNYLKSENENPITKSEEANHQTEVLFHKIKMKMEMKVRMNCLIAPNKSLLIVQVSQDTVFEAIQVSNEIAKLADNHFFCEIIVYFQDNQKSKKAIISFSLIPKKLKNLQMKH